MGRRIITWTALLGLLVAGSGCRRPGPAWNVVFVLVDTLRPDHLHCYGYERETSPILDRLASEGALFEQAHSQAPWTICSVTSILTSLYPFRHGVLHPSLRRRVPDSVWTLAEVLRRRGYEAAAFVANLIVLPETGLDQGFLPFDLIPRRYGSRDDAALVNRDALPWLREHAGGPFFLYLHYMDPHDPYDDPASYHRLFDPADGPPSRGRIQPVFARMKKGEAWELDPRTLHHLVARYDGEIRFVDEKIGEVLAAIDQLGLRERTLVVMTSDHGEQFLEHGSLKHATSVHEEEIRVPVLVRYPHMPRRGVRFADPVESVDLMPTILDLLGLEAPDPLDGRSLVPLLEGRSLPPKPLFAETSHGWQWKDRRVTNTRSLHLTMIRAGRKLILRPDSRSLYDLRVDPGETLDLAARSPGLADRLAREVTRWKDDSEARAYPPQLVPLAEMEKWKKALRNLGYLDDGQGAEPPGAEPPR